MGALPLWSMSLMVAMQAVQPPLTRFDVAKEAASAENERSADHIATTTDRFDRMTVPVTLGGKGPYRFLVDTGSDRTVISRELAATLDLGSAGRATVHSASGASHASLVRLPDLDLSRRKLQGISAPTLFQTDLGADGILGIDTLRAQRILFDFRRERLSIVSTDTPISTDERDAIVVRARRLGGRLVLTDAQAGGRIDVVLDTGSQYSVGNSALRRQLERRGTLRIIGPTDLVSVTGRAVPGIVGIADHLTIGGVELNDVAIIFAEAHTFGELDLADKPAMLMGMNLLRGFDMVSIDFTSRRLRFLLPNQRRSETRTP